MTDPVSENNQHQSNTVRKVENTFEFERLLKTAAGKLEQDDIAVLNGFKQCEMTINSDIEVFDIGKSSQFADKIELSYQQYMKSVNAARAVLSNAFQGTPDPDKARGNWDAGKEFEARELHENTLISLQHYIEKSCTSIKENYATILDALKPKNIDETRPVTKTVSRNQKENEPFKPTPLRDIMDFKK